MRHYVAFLAAIAALCPALSAEDSSSRQLFSSDLVMWSYLQQGQTPEQDHPHQQPTPEPVPETQPAQSPTTSPAERPPGAASGTPAGTAQQTFTGIISKEADSYMLKVSASVSYKLDNQEQVEQYEGRRVRVTGSLDSSANLIHVDKVEPLS